MGAKGARLQKIYIWFVFLSSFELERPENQHLRVVPLSIIHVTSIGYKYTLHHITNSLQLLYLAQIHININHK